MTLYPMPPKTRYAFKSEISHNRKLLLNKMTMVRANLHEFEDKHIIEAQAPENTALRLKQGKQSDCVHTLLRANWLNFQILDSNEKQKLQGLKKLDKTYLQISKLGKSKKTANYEIISWTKSSTLALRQFERLLSNEQQTAHIIEIRAYVWETMAIIHEIYKNLKSPRRENPSSDIS